MAPTSEVTRVKPVFIRTRDLPMDTDDRITTREICAEAEKSVGYDTMEGAERIGGLWRVYPKTQAARMQLLINGLALRNTHVRFNDENPFLVKDSTSNGGTVETTKVFISNIPISFANREIEEKIMSMNCQLASKIIDECDRDEKGKLTRWKTGRRFVFIAVPAVPLPTQINIGPFTARIYHREQKLTNVLTCGNCLQTGHRKHECEVEVVCRQCHKSGHKSGEAKCEPLLLQADIRETTPKTQDHVEAVNADITSGSEIADDDEDGELSDTASSSNEAKRSKRRKLKKRKRVETSSDSSVTGDSEEKSSKLVNDQPSPVSVDKQHGQDGGCT